MYFIEPDIIINGKRISKSLIKCTSLVNAELILQDLYNQVLNAWKADGLMYDSNECYFFVSDRKKHNTYKARIVKK